MTRRAVALAGCFCIIGSLISGYFLSRIILEARATSDWPVAEGRLVRAQVQQAGAGRFRPDVAYDYEVDGQAYSGSRIRTSDGEYDSREGAAQAIQGLHPGQLVTVHYNPANPAASVLKAGAGFQEYALIAVPGVMFAMGFFALLRLRRAGTDRSAEQVGSPMPDR